MKPIVVQLLALGFLALVSGSLTCGCGKTVLRGEPEMEGLIKAMEDTVAAKGQGKDKLMAAIQQVIAADKKVQDLQLTEAEQKALDEKYADKRETLRKKIEE